VGCLPRNPDIITARQWQLQRSAEIKMSAFDALPKKIREVLANFALEPADCQPILNLYYTLRQHGLSTDTIAEAISAQMLEAEQQAIASTNTEHRSRYGEDLPHIAANATPMRSARTG
jgi:hypothetical protein